MNSSNLPANVEDGVVVTLDYTVTVDGEVVDSSENDEPIQFIQGTGQIVIGLEKVLYGMAVGESKSVVVAAEEAYGEIDPEAIADIPRSEFPDDIPLETGVELQLRNDDDELLEAFIESVGPDTVRLNFNHPLAGKSLDFMVTVVGLREATPEEADHGHVHEEGHHHH